VAIRGTSAGLVLGLLWCLGGVASAQGRTDVVTLANGDRITGEVVELERGRLEFKTDDIGTLYLEWDKLVSVTALTRQFEITVTDGRRILGSLGPAPAGSIGVIGRISTTLAMNDVTHVYVIGSSFWSKLDGSISSGFNYTRSSGVAQLNVNADTTFRRPGFQVSVSASFTSTVTQTDEGDRSDPNDRGIVGVRYVRFLPRRWALMGIGQFESNESLGLVLRSEAGAAVGPRLVDTNRAQLWVGGGLMLNREQGVDVEATTNVEAVVYLQTSFYTYDRPKTTIDIGFQYLPSLNTPGRHRVQFNADVMRELVKDLIVSANLYDSFDSQPPNELYDVNDVGVVLSIGWTF
jgi:Protein of unknown function, DUF481